MVHDEDELYSVQSMADLLFGNTDAVSCYASHRLLSQERMYFKQAGRNPPLFQARAPQDVHALTVKRELEKKVCLASLLAHSTTLEYHLNCIRCEALRVKRDLEDKVCLASFQVPITGPRVPLELSFTFTSRHICCQGQARPTGEGMPCFLLGAHHSSAIPFASP